MGPGQGLRPWCPWAPLPGHAICNPPCPRLHPASSGVCSSGVPACLVLAVRTSLGDPRWIRSHELPWEPCHNRSWQGAGDWFRCGGIPLTSVGPGGFQRPCFRAGPMGPGSVPRPHACRCGQTQCLNARRAAATWAGAAVLTALKKLAPWSVSENKEPSPACRALDIPLSSLFHRLV